MAINRLQFGGLLNPRESFGWEDYGEKGPFDPTPKVYGGGIFGQMGGAQSSSGQPCPKGQVRNAAGQCVPITQPCPTGQVRNAAGQCVTQTQTQPCPTGQRRNAAGNCVTIINGPQPCPNPNHVRNAAGVCGPKTGTGPESGCPQDWSRDQWGICRPPQGPQGPDSPCGP